MSLGHDRCEQRDNTTRIGLDKMNSQASEDEGASMPADYMNKSECEQIFSVLDATWPRIVPGIRTCAKLGWDWKQVTTPFVGRKDGEIVAHVGVLRSEMFMQGARLPIAGIHAVSCKPEYRGNGLMREAMEQALSYVDEIGQIALLTCSQPDIYTRFGFTAYPEHRGIYVRSSEGPVDQPLCPFLESGLPLSALQLELSARVPTSTRWSMVDSGAVFGICEYFEAGGLRRIHCDNEGKLFVVYEVHDGTLELIDVVTRELPELAQILRMIPERFSRVRCHFTVDTWEEPDEWEPLPSDDVLMLRGEGIVPAEICLPETARW